MAEKKKDPVPSSVTIPYYPSYRYIEKNLAPERIPLSDLTALANAQRTAEKAGVLSPEVAKYMLANSMIEGRYSKSGEGSVSADFGVRGGNVFHGLNPNVKKVIKALKLEETTKPPYLNPEDVFSPSVLNSLQASGKPLQKYNKTDVVITPSDDPAINATYATAILGIKAAEAKDAEDAIRRWNGQGAGAENHLRKVKEAQDMLAHPRNAAVLQMYQNALMNENSY